MDNKLKIKLFDLQNLNMSFKKTKDNPYFKSKYLPLDLLMKGLLPYLKEQKLLIFHRTKDGVVETVVQDMETMETIESQFPLQAGIDPQKVGSAITYAKRYNIGQIFNIITDEDDDGNKAGSKGNKKNVDKFFSQITPTNNEIL